MSEVRGGRFTVTLPLRQRQSPEALAAERADWERQAAEAQARGDAVKVRDCRAHAERARRWIARLQDIPQGDVYRLSCSAYRLGESVWVTTGGEPYNWLQQELQRRFPEVTLLVSPLDGNLQVAYLLTRGEYGKGLYQEEPSILAPGCLEELCEQLTEHVRPLVADGAPARTSS